jgi:hypothetical protein
LKLATPSRPTPDGRGRRAQQAGRLDLPGHIDIGGRRRRIARQVLWTRITALDASSSARRFPRADHQGVVDVPSFITSSAISWFFLSRARPELLARLIDHGRADIGQ